MGGSSDPQCLIVGAGLSGLAAALALGDDAIVLEAEDRPGGLVRSEPIDVERVGRFWFDHVLHLLYFPDEETRARICAMADAALAPCRPVAYVETRAGTTLYPVQMHLAPLPLETRVRCLADLARTLQTEAAAPADLEQALRQTFGDGLSELFLLPYNRKAWARPLSELRGKLAWTVTRPDFEQVLRGALTGEPGFTAYNVDGFYPRPAPDAPWRGMELLARALAARVTGLRLSHRVERIDTRARALECATPHGPARLPYRNLVSTMPLPRLIDATADLPDGLRARAARLTHNRVWTVALCLTGDSPADTGHWRYYGDETLCFTRLVFMDAFDPGTAPAGCRALMAEIVEPAEFPAPPRDAVIRRAIDDARRAGAIRAGDTVVGADAWAIDPAYVVFTDETEEIVDALRQWFEARDVHLLGRYGRWEYSSMAQVMRDGFALGARLKVAAC
jgi:protoporphyrinogen oxidase